MKPFSQDNPIRVLIVDDSSFIRVTFKKLLESDKLIKVVGMARNGLEAVAMVRTTRPDLVTLDIEMPVMDGLSALKRLMRDTPLPVIMISSHTKEGSVATLNALELGAVDFIPKRSDGIFAGINELQAVLIEKVKSCATYRPGPVSAILRPLPVKLDRRGLGEIDVVAIGASTGGPRALLDVIPLLPREFAAAVLVVQHMPKGFTATFAERLNSKSHLSVKEAEDGDPIEPGRVLVAPGGLHLVAATGPQGSRVVHLSETPVGSLFCPSVDVMMGSVSAIYGRRVLAVIMTGMGCDGTQGMRIVKRHEGITLAQDKESCVVYGMPQAAAKVGVVDRTVTLSRLAQQIVDVAQGERIISRKKELC